MKTQPVNRKILLSPAIPILLLLLLGCTALEKGKERDAVDFIHLKETIPGFTLEKKIPPEVGEYLDYYELPRLPGSYWFGYIDCGEYKCAAHLFLPSDNPRGTILLIHGFLSHFGIYQDLIPLLLNNNWAVAGIDLPGHGISLGKPTAIDDFSSYGRSVASLLEAVKSKSPGPFIGVGHSMGCAALLEYRKIFTNGIARYIFIAPLVRSAMFNLSEIGFSLLDPLMDSLPRAYQKTTSDSEYLKFKEFHDPLQVDSIDPSWARALFRWNERIENEGISPMELTVIQGDKDAVVDYRYNLEFFRNHLEDVKIFTIDGGRHELLKEKPVYKNELFRLILVEINIDEPPARIKQNLMSQTIRCLLLCALLLLCTGLAAEPRSMANENDYKVSLVTTGPGSEVYLWWGHSALMVENQRTRQESFYDFGVFSFETEHFFRNFIFGRLWYMGYRSSAEVNINRTIREDRNIQVQELRFPPGKKLELIEDLENRVSPGKPQLSL